MIENILSIGPKDKEKGRTLDKAEVTKQVSPELERAATKRARDRANAARWNLKVAVFLFAVVILVIILVTYTKMGVEIVAPIAIFGLVKASARAKVRLWDSDKH